MATPSSDPDDLDDLDYGATLKGLRPGLKVFRRFSLERQLGRGGMGVVWLGRDEHLGGRQVALKFLPDLVQGDEVAIAELKTETLRSLDLTHPHIVRIYDWVADEDLAAISMEYVDGHTLSGLRLRQPSGVFEVPEISTWTEQLCAALTYAHGEKRTVHRDLKPSNLMVDTAGRLRVMDFGIAGSLTDSMSRLSAAAMPASGTLVYMSPQQAMGYPPSVADDVYSLGATLYELLTGKPPFYRGNIQHQIETVVPCSIMERRGQLEVEGTDLIPEAWEQTIAACLAKDPKQRPSGAVEVWARLNGAVVAKPYRTVPLPSSTASPRRKSRNTASWKTITAVASVAGLVVGLGLWWALQHGSAGRDDTSPTDAVPAMSHLEVVSAPAGATIRVGGADIGTTSAASPLSHELAAGSHEIEAVYRSWPVQKRTVEMKGGETEAMSFTFEPVSLRVESTPSGATVKEAGSGRVLGITPVELAGNLEPGQTALELTLAGHEPGSWSGALVPGLNQPVTATLEPVSKLLSGSIGDSWDYDLGGGETLVMKYVPGGTFTMGSPSYEEMRSDTEDQVSVTLSSHYWLGETELTQGQWKAVMGNNPSDYSEDGDDRMPVETVSWDDAQAFIATLNGRGGLPDGWSWSLPTEAQWERACRAGTQTVFAFGNRLSSQQANMDGSSPYGGAEPGPYVEKHERQPVRVANYQPNGWGLHDMHGNVDEWCEDAWDGETRLPGGTDPLGTSGSNRILRGGQYFYGAEECRSAYRSYAESTARNSFYGFRVALTSRRAE